MGARTVAGMGMMLLNMTDASVDPSQARINGLLDAFARTRNGKSPPELHLGQALDELGEWLDDDRQWRSGQPQHWKSLLEDVRRRLSELSALSEGDLQHRINGLIVELRALGPGFRSDGGVPDESLRRRLRRIVRLARELARHPDLLPSAWRRIATWSTAGEARADTAVGALRDLVQFGGRDSEQVLETLRDVLRDHDWVIARLQERAPSDEPYATSGLSPRQRLELAESVLTTPASHGKAVVWLEYLQAQLLWPLVVQLGSSVSLYRESFLRSIIHQAPDDERVPPELRDVSSSGLPSWLCAFDPAEAVRADYTVRGDPRVYLRIELEEMPLAHALPAARETAEFLTAFASLFASNHETWLLSPSYFIVGQMSSTHAFTFDEDAARDALHGDMTATHLLRHAHRLEQHLPLRDPKLRTAGRLLVWLRRATATDNPAQLVLCERVIEQVCGWAGVSEPTRFVTEYLRPDWVNQQIRREIENTYWEFWSSVRGSHPLQARIETSGSGQSAGGAVLRPNINLKRILENLGELVDASPPDSVARARLTRLQGRADDANAARSWIKELFAEFDRRNARLRRTRNALIHGGPIVSSTVDNVSVFAATLAHYAMGTAIEQLLDNTDPVEGFLDQQQWQLRRLEQIRSGTPAAAALFGE